MCSELMSVEEIQIKKFKMYFNLPQLSFTEDTD